MPLHKYQMEDIKWWVDNNYRGAFYWEPGLGKTYTAGWLINALLEKKRVETITIIVPKIILTTWQEELDKYNIDYFVYSTEKKEIINKPVKLINYELIPHRYIYRETGFKVKKHFRVKIYKKNNETESVKYNKTIIERPDLFYKDFHADLYILDESHNIKSYKSIIYKFIRYLITKTPGYKLLLLSGTPFPNGMIDSYTQLDLIKPGIVGKNITDFRNKFCRLKNRKTWTYEITPAGNELLNIIANKLAKFRTTEMHNEGLPEKNILPIYYELDELSETIRKDITYKKILKINDLELPLNHAAIRLMLLQQLNSGYIKSRLTIFDEIYEIDETINPNPNKMEILVDKLRSIKDKQAIIWVNFIQTGRMLLERLDEEDFSVYLFNSQDNKKLRKQVLTNYKNGKVQFIISHPKILGTGLNVFQNTQYMFWYELTYDYTLYEQAFRRIYRQKQKHKSIFSYEFINKKSVDMHIKYALDKKMSYKDLLFNFEQEF